MRVQLMVAIVALMGVAAVAGASDQQAPEPIVATGGFPHDLMVVPVTNAPYSAVWVNQIVTTLGDGTKITKGGHHFVARDSAGRERLEIHLGAAKDGKPAQKLIFVIDPVAHTFTSWGEGTNGPKVATVAKMRDMGATPTAARPKQNDSRPQPEITHQDLGSQIIDNLPVTGELTTTVVPIGRSGNDQPITKTHEVWTSDEMKLVLLQKWTDPRTGVRTTQLEKFSRTEPDATLFHPPAGYQVKTAEQTLRELAEKLQKAADAQE